MWRDNKCAQTHTHTHTHILDYVKSKSLQVLVSTDCGLHRILRVFHGSCTYWIAAFRWLQKNKIKNKPPCHDCHKPKLQIKYPPTVNSFPQCCYDNQLPLKGQRNECRDIENSFQTHQVTKKTPKKPKHLFIHIWDEGKREPLPCGHEWRRTSDQTIGV